jgi:hypothetical protein
MQAAKPLCLLTLALLSACSEKTVTAPPPVVAVAAAPKPVAAPTTDEKVDAMLLKAVFGKHYRPATKDALVTLPDPEDRAATGQYVVTAAGNTVLATGETVLVVNGEQANEAGEADSSHASGGLLSVYFLRQKDGKWTITKRHENIASLGSNGQMGSVSWTTLATGKPGLAIESGGTWQGYTVENLALFDLSAATMRELSNVSIHSDSEGGCDEAGTSECWSVTGKWRFAPAKTAAEYDDLLVDFTGNKSNRKTESAKRVSEKISGTARYAYDGKKYELVEGENLVPGV